MHQRIGRRALFSGLAAMLLILMYLSLAIGYRLYSPGEIWRAVTAFDSSEAHVVIRDLRLPRALMAPLVGAALGISGVLVQTLSRNRIASPDTLGLNAGAAFAVVMASGLFGVASLPGLSMAAAVGALATSLLVFGLAAAAGGISPLRIVLVGVTFAGLFDSFVNVVLTVNETMLDQLLFWLAGSFADRKLSLALNGLPFVLIGGGIAFYLTRSLDILQTDDSTARGLGVPLGAVRGLSFVAVALLSGASVAMAGPVLFVGLVVPHAARALVGLEHRLQIVAAALVGAVYTTLADIVARFVIFPREAPVGAVTAIVGGCLLLILLRRRAA
ncbi:iron ABC transporter permease [Aminobacter sp. BA135]|uniref:FecCD family ABC transporter permease n=1 Tax=Aminobacter sp. BA135 TaxID=537596 RepID=UPI003D79FC68